ncbi:hypothetical protein HUJ04_007793 [Dendroctonus ponderosae]|nr:hypothetical protein HUJ04_007793 [Dendroctonus ponderosae]
MITRSIADGTVRTLSRLVEPGNQCVPYADIKARTSCGRYIQALSGLRSRRVSVLWNAARLVPSCCYWPVVAKIEDSQQIFLKLRRTRTEMKNLRTCEERIIRETPLASSPSAI